MDLSLGALPLRRAFGLAVLVTVYGTASRSALTAPKTVSAGTVHAARQAFVYGADRAFTVAAVFLLGTLALVALAVRPQKR